MTGRSASIDSVKLHAAKPVVARPRDHTQRGRLGLVAIAKATGGKTMLTVETSHYVCRSVSSLLKIVCIG